MAFPGAKQNAEDPQRTQNSLGKLRGGTLKELRKAPTLRVQRTSEEPRGPPRSRVLHGAVLCYTLPYLGMCVAYCVEQCALTHAHIKMYWMLTP
jgi:hypothetical protein